jgi:conjugal transfer/type IV secretion protein DotA/TraY
MKGLYKKIILMFSLLSAKAFAVGDEIFVLQDGDKVGSAFKSLFCELASTCGSDAFSELVGILNYVIIFFIGFVSCYFMFKSISAPAVDGKTGDGKFHWHVIRFFLGCAIVWPVVGSNGNYSTANFFVYKVAEHGIAVASYAARTAVKDSSLSKIAATSMMPPETLNLSHNLFLSSVCMRGAEKFLGSDVTYLNSTGGKKIVEMGFTETSSLTNKIIKFGNKNNGGFGISDSECGEVNIPLLQSTLDKNSQKIATKINNRTIALIKDIDAVAVRFVDNPNYELYKEVMSLSYSYQQAIKLDSYDIVRDEDRTKELYQSIEKDGFLHLGAMTNRITQVIHDTNKSINKIPVATGIPEVKNIHIKEYLNSDYIKEINKVIEKFDAPYGSGISGIAGNSDSSWSSVVKDPTLLVKKIFASTAYTIDRNDNIFVVMQKFGGWLMLVATGALTLASTAILTAGNVPLVSAGTSALLGVLIGVVILPILGFAATCLFVLPNIPTFIWYGGVVSYMISCSGAIIVASFIPATMILGGDAIMGQAVNALKQLLSMLFKPLLMVALYFLAIVLMNFVGQLILPTFFDVWNMSQDNSNIFTYIASLWIFPFVYFTFMYFLITTVFKNTMNLSDVLVSWMGGAHGFAINGGSAEFGSAGGSMGAAVTGAAAGGVASGVSEIAKLRSQKNGGESALDRLNKSMPMPANQSGGSTKAFGNASKGVGSPNSLNAAKAASSGSGDGGEAEQNGSFDDMQSNQPIEDDFDATQYEGLDDCTKDYEKYEAYTSSYQSFAANNPNSPDVNAKHYAVDSAISWKHGRGAGKIVKQAGNGSYGNEDAVKMYNSLNNNRDKNTQYAKNLDGNLTGQELIDDYKNFISESNMRRIS